MKQINVTVTELTTFKRGDFVICGDVIGFVTSKKGTVVNINWIDKAKTQHHMDDLVKGYDGVTVILHPDNLPSFAR